MQESLCLQTALEMLRSGLPVTVIRPGSKIPVGKRWEVAYRTQESIESAFAQYPEAGVALILGDRGDGRGVVDLEIDDPSKAEKTLGRIFPNGIPATLHFHSNRGTHYLFQYDSRLSWFGASVVQGEHFEGIEVRIGTTDPSKSQAKQSLIPPTPRSNGEPRQFYCLGTLLEPSDAVRRWEDVISPFPEELFKYIDLFHAGNVEGGDSPQWSADAVKKEILGRGVGYVVDLVKGWGLRLTHDTPNASGWIESHAIGRTDANPSARFDPSTGVYLDYGGGERSLSIFSVAVELGVFPNFPSAVNGIGRALDLPPSRTVRKESVPVPGDHGLDPWSEPQDVLPPEVPPYPTDIYPDSLANFLEEASLAVDCPADYLGVCMIAAAGGSIGNSVHLRITESYRQPAHLFAAFIGPPGNRKTSAVNVVSAPLHVLDAIKRSQYLDAIEELNEDERQKKGPLHQLTIGSDSTKEAIAQALADNPRGLGMPMDEIAGLVANLNAYRGGRGDDRQFFLSVNSGASIKVNRKGTPVPLILRNPCLSIWGPLTPSKLTHLKGGDTDDGWFDRFVLSYPATPVLSEEWETPSIPPHLSERWRVAVERLASIPCLIEGGAAVPTLIDMTAGARAVYGEWFSALRQEMNADSKLRGPWSKLEGYCLRFALILSLLDSVAGSLAKSLPDAVDADAMERACRLANYHREHARKVHQELSYRISGIDELGRRILERIAKGISDAENGRQTQLSTCLENATPHRIITYRLLRIVSKLGEDELDRVITWLSESGYLQPLPQSRGVGRPSLRYAINPIWKWEDYAR